MSEPRPDTHQKALSINLDASVYGTLAEIGAGQEVARWFLQVGAASGTVAKTISAYDMTVSDAIYGKATRYVSRERVEAMLAHEYDLVCERLSASKGATTRFFAFADTIAARNFSGTNECHGWLGVRFQTAPGGAANSVVLHVNLLDSNNLLQQQAVGILGVNLIYAVLHHSADAEDFLTALHDELGGRVEVDLIAVDSPDLPGIDDRLLTLELLRTGLAEAVLLPVEGPPVPPDEVLRKRPLVLAPGVFEEPDEVHAALLAGARQRLESELAGAARPPLSLFVLVSRHPDRDVEPSSAEMLRRVDALREMGSDVLVTRAPQLYRIVRYALRYTNAEVRIAVGAASIADLMASRHYRNLDGELLEGLAHLFACNVRLYVYPTPASLLERLDPASRAWFGAPQPGGMTRLEDLVIPPPLSHLVTYLVESGFMQSVPAL
ncbi:MAG: hypothetical protein SF182_04570 [Deltaproteobacteria bacterium]|nr:hypothetical protein [Deltaproteobacteria bacterium]